jgi:hypothetical protein
MFERLKALVGWGPPRDGWGLLAKLNAKSFVDWGRGRAESLQAAWETCPRCDWLLEVALVLRMDNSSTERCLRACADRIDKRNRPLRAEVRALADRWRAASDDAHRSELLGAFGQLLCRAIDEDPRVTRARRQQSTGDATHRRVSDKALAGWAAGDAAETAMMRAFADCARAEIAADEVIRQIDERLQPVQQGQAGPYR